MIILSARGNVVACHEIVTALVSGFTETESIVGDGGGAVVLNVPLSTVALIKMISLHVRKLIDIFMLIMFLKVIFHLFLVEWV